MINVILSKHQRMTKKWEVKDLTHMPNKDHGFEYHNVVLFKHQRMTKKWEVKDLTHMPNKDHGFEIGLFTTERQSFNSYVLSLQWWLNYKGVLQANGI